jgi:hypothetical protein
MGVELVSYVNGNTFFKGVSEKDVERNIETRDGKSESTMRKTNNVEANYFYYL